MTLTKEEWENLLVRAEAQVKGFTNALEEGQVVVEAYKAKIASFSETQEEKTITEVEKEISDAMQ